MAYVVVIHVRAFFVKEKHMFQSAHPGGTSGIGPFADNFIPVIPVEYEYHTDTRLFCHEPDCPCHTDPDNIAQLQQDYEAGLISAQDAELIFKGKTL